MDARVGRSIARFKQNRPSRVRLLVRLIINRSTGNDGGGFDFDGGLTGSRIMMRESISGRVVPVWT